jgi:hypothetical protein
LTFGKLYVIWYLFFAEKLIPCNSASVLKIGTGSHHVVDSHKLHSRN